MTCLECGGNLVMHCGGERESDTGYQPEAYAKCEACGEVFDSEDLEPQPARENQQEAA